MGQKKKKGQGRKKKPNYNTWRRSQAASRQRNSRGQQTRSDELSSSPHSIPGLVEPEQADRLRKELEAVKHEAKEEKARAETLTHLLSAGRCAPVEHHRKEEEEYNEMRQEYTLALQEKLKLLQTLKDRATVEEAKQVALSQQ